MGRSSALLLLLLAQPAHSSEMMAISSETGFCGQTEDKSAMCYEWSFESRQDLRFVAYGYEDGIEYDFYTLGIDNKYKHVVRVYPVIRDKSRNDVLFWGYPWDIQDIALAPGKRQESVLATFEHDLVDDGEVNSPYWQKRVPAVLFIGSTTHPAMTVPQLKFKANTVEDLRAGAGAGG